MSGLISVIVPAYPVDATVRGYLMECLARLRKNRCQLILVQNGGEPVDADVDVFLYKPQPIGFTRALNLGLAAADGIYLAQVAADVYVEPDWAEAMQAELKKYGPGLVCPFHYRYEGPIVENRIWMAAWMKNREVFTRLGYHDEMLNYRFSDQDYAVRVKKAGYRVFSTGVSLVRHVEEGSTVNKIPEQLNQFETEAAVMVTKHGHRHFCDWVARQ